MSGASGRSGGGRAGSVRWFHPRSPVQVPCCFHVLACIRQGVKPAHRPRHGRSLFFLTALALAGALSGPARAHLGAAVLATQYCHAYSIAGLAPSAASTYHTSRPGRPLGPACLGALPCPCSARTRGKRVNVPAVFTYG